MKVIIIGGGIAGLAVGIGLERIGIETAIYEQASEPRTQGSGLTLWANALKALKQLGVDYEAYALEFNGFIRKSNGNTLIEYDEQALKSKFGVASMAIHRADLLNSLIKAYGKPIHYGLRLSHYAQDSNSITAIFDKQQTASGGILIGADGIHSHVRKQIHPTASPVYQGYGAWRGIAENISHHQVWGETWGLGARFGFIPLPSNRIYWFGTSNRPANTPPVNHREALRSQFSGWHEPIQQIIIATPDEAILYNDVLDIDPLTTWIDKRAILIGDSAHAMTPNLGQGACQAIEDAVALTQAFEQSSKWQEALATFESRRLKHTRAVQLQSRRIGRIGQLANPIINIIRDTITTLTPSSILMKQLEPILQSSS